MQRFCRLSMRVLTHRDKYNRVQNTLTVIPDKDKHTQCNTFMNLYEY